MKIITIHELIGMVMMLLAYIPGKILKYKHNDIWIISERPNDVQDNGYHLYKYIMDNDLHKDTFYSLNYSSPYLEKIKKYNNVLNYESFKHYCYIWACSKYISTQVGSGLPIPRVSLVLLNKKIFRFKNIFLQHGVTCNFPDWLMAEKNNIDLFVCASDNEKKFVIDGLGYKLDNVKTLGFCRFDNLKNEFGYTNSILFFPTWRKELDYNDSLTYKENCENFKKSKYYNTIQSLLNNIDLIYFIESNNIQMVLYLHDNMQIYTDLFESKSNNIHIISKNMCSIQTLLNYCSYFITDYSSVSFDFSYLLKPIQYFQFDYENFRSNHYKEGYFEYFKDGFGPVTYDIAECVFAIKESYVNDKFIIDKKYMNRIKEFFKYNDSLNCRRNYDAINNIN